MRRNKWIVIVVSLYLYVIPNISTAANESELNELYESIGYYSSAHDVLVWFSETQQCKYIYTNNQIPSFNTIRSEILSVLPKYQQKEWLNYYGSQKNKKNIWKLDR